MAPSHVAQQWTVEDGLPVNTINDLLQTDDGYLWLATFDGLVCFDGVQFTTYQSGTYDRLPSSRILKLFADGNALWLHTESKGLVHMQAGQFRVADLPDVYDVFRTADDRLWVSTQQGLYRQVDRRSFEHVLPEIEGLVSTVHQAPDGTLWAGTKSNGVYQHLPDGTLTHITEADGLADVDVITLESAPDGSTLIGSWGGLQRWEDGQLMPVPHQGEALTSPIFQMESTRNGDVWLRTDTHVYRYQDGQATQVATQNERPTFQPQGSLVERSTTGAVWINASRTLWHRGDKIFSVPAEISQLMYDHEQSLWVATQGEGLFQVRPSQVDMYGAPEGLASSNVYSILQRHNQDIWLGTLGGGATRLSTRDTTSFSPPKGTSALDNVWSLHETRDSTLWLGGNRLCEWTGTGCARPDAEGPIVGKRILVIHEDRAGRLWAGTVDGLYRRSASSENNPGAWVRYGPENSNLPHRIVRSVHEAENGALWFGTNGGGVAIYHEGAFMPFTTTHGLPSNLVRPVWQDAEGVFWVGTEDRGLARIALPDDRPLTEAIREADITTYNEQSGLFDNGIHHIEEDSQGRLWMSSNRGVFWIEKDDLEAVAAGTQTHVASTSYTERDGMRNREANGGTQPAGIHDNQGRLWFATQEGAAVFQPDSIKENSVPPPLHIEHVATTDSTYGLSASETLQLAPHERDFMIDYTALSFAAPSRVRFSYQLQGFDTDWRGPTEGRTATYTNIPPGTYTFAVRASNHNSAWNENSATLQITIAPYFYETWWFWGGIALLGLGTIVAGYRMRIWHLEKRQRTLNKMVEARTETIRAEKEKNQQALATVIEQAQQLEQIDASRTRFFSHISHELRTPLTLMLGPINTLLNDPSDALSSEREQQLRMAQRSAQRLAQLVEQLHDLAKVETGTLSVQAEYADIVATIAEAVEAFNSLAMQHNITLTCDSTPGTYAMAFDKAKVEKVVGNLLSNALEATDDGGSIRVTVRPADAASNASERGVALTVEDTGAGIPTDQQDYLQQHFDQETSTWTLGNPRLGIGLNLVHELARLHGGRVDFDSEVGRGTRFTVYLMDQTDQVDDIEVDDAEPPPHPDATTAEKDASDVSAVPATSASSPSEDYSAPPEDESPEEAVAPANDPDDLDEKADRPVVLVIDDDDDFRTYIRWHLAADYHVEEAAGGHAGYEAAQRILPDIVLLDVMMPALDGFELCAMIKEHPDIDHIPVIMLTARVDAESRVEGLDAGADAYLTKPFDANELEVRIENLLASRRTLQEAFQRRGGIPDADALAPSSSARPTPESEPELVESIETCIAECFSDPEFGATELAEEVALSASHLRRKMKMHYDRTPIQLIRYRRLQAGAQLLRNHPDTTIGEIAYAVGFNSQSYFTRSFRDAFGQTPSAYRAEHAS
ncbi:hybrid sensor histidine kinase/response regulator transcription factor [Longimonas halophila]|uniref:hybrid sensor histidine kinase/response regulator transcription factor n=1 Tax=Longimonas halophila TaxID=1469170 RepID=UPI001596DB55|nr:two-component regulator propeller domain-containing protein [Longimonas halophila]